ncbi:MAG: CrcB family protein [Acidimicrobiales bacterium]
MTPNVGAASPSPNDDFTLQRSLRRHSLQRRLELRRAQIVIVVALSCGGALGAVARYWVTLALPTSAGHFPWSTFTINVTGSAILGFLLILLIEQFPRGRLARPFIGSGILGAYTTFSTLEVDTLLLFRDNAVLTGVTYLVSSLLAGLVAMWIGMNGARIVVRVELWLQGET